MECRKPTFSQVANNTFLHGPDLDALCWTSTCIITSAQNEIVFLAVWITIPRRNSFQWWTYTDRLTQLHSTPNTDCCYQNSNIFMPYMYLSICMYVCIHTAYVYRYKHIKISCLLISKLEPIKHDCAIKPLYHG
jgi:hypothetical protein